MADFIRTHTANLQTIVISLKEEFYSHADALIGVCPDVSISHINLIIMIVLSTVLTLYKMLVIVKLIFVQKIFFFKFQPGECLISKMLILDLTTFPDDAVAQR